MNKVEINFDNLYDLGQKFINRGNDPNAFEYNNLCRTAYFWGSYEPDFIYESIMKDVKMFKKAMDSFDADLYKKAKKDYYRTNKKKRNKDTTIPNNISMKISDKDYYSFIFLFYFYAYLSNNEGVCFKYFNNFTNCFNFKNLDKTEEAIEQLNNAMTVITAYNEGNNTVVINNSTVDISSIISDKTMNILPNGESWYDSYTEIKYTIEYDSSIRDNGYYKNDFEKEKDYIMPVILEYLMSNKDLFDPEYIFERFASKDNIFYNTLYSYRYTKKDLCYILFLRLYCNKDTYYRWSETVDGNYRNIKLTLFPKAYYASKKVIFNEKILRKKVAESLYIFNELFDIDKANKTMSNYNYHIKTMMFTAIPAIYNVLNTYKCLIILNNGIEKYNELEKDILDTINKLVKTVENNPDIFGHYINEFINRTKYQNTVNQGLYSGNALSWTIKERYNNYYLVLTFIRNKFKKEIEEGIDVCKKYHITSNNLTTLLLTAI